MTLERQSVEKINQRSLLKANAKSIGLYLKWIPTNLRLAPLVTATDSERAGVIRNSPVAGA